MALSTIESLVLTYQPNSGSNYANKLFKNYDKVNYQSKNRLELLSQLKTHIIIFKASMTTFKEENADSNWSLPKNFN